MGRTVICDATIFTAADNSSGTTPFVGTIVIEGDRIVSLGTDPIVPREGDTVIQAKGLFCMPGMTEGHAHLSFENVTTAEDLIGPSPETQVFTTARGAKALVEAGFTNAYGASEAKVKLAAAVRDEINAGRIIGPRIRAAGIEITVTGAMGDESKAHNPRIGISTIIDGAEEMRKAVRLHCREGVDNIKIDVSGDPFYPSTPGHSTPMTYEEVRVAVETAHAYGRKINAHTRSVEGSKHCLRAGVDALLHTEYSDEELLDMMEEARDRIFVVPTPGLFAQIMAGDAAAFGLSPEIGRYMNIPELLENSVKTHTELRKRGIRHLIGGDYGFAWSPQGTQGRDLKFFVDHYGYSPADALVCATRHGGRAMGHSDLGSLEVGNLADIVLIDGDPLKDISILNGPANIVFVMRGGAVQKSTLSLAATADAPALQTALSH